MASDKSAPRTFRLRNETITTLNAMADEHGVSRNRLAEAMLRIVLDDWTRAKAAQSAVQADRAPTLPR